MKKIFKALALALAGAMFMVACDDTPAPYNPNPGGGEGGKDTTVVTEKKITCAEAAELCKALTDNASSVEAYTITGYITDVLSIISNNQQSFWMADTKDGGKVIQAFYANFPEGVKKFAAGSKVTITGRLFKYVKADGTVILEVKNPKVVIMEQGGGEAGAEATKVTCAKAVELCNALADNAYSVETYAVTGYITEVNGEPSKNQQIFWMADTKDGGKVFNAFYANLPEGVERFVVGSKVTVTGKLLKYVKEGTTTATPEMKNADVTIIETGGGTVTPDQPVEGTPSGTGVESDPYNVAGALAYIQTLSAEDKPEALVYTKGVISEVVKLGTSGSIQFKMQDKNVNNSLLVYYCNNLGNVAFKAQTDLKVGDEVIVCGKVVNYAGNTPEYAPGAYLVSLNGKTEGEGGGSTPGGEEKPGVGNTIVMSEAYSSCTDGSVEAGTITFGDATITFEKNDGNNAPMYYFNKKESLRSVRMYAKNSMEMTATKNIAKVVINCAAPYQGTNYNGNDQMTTTAGTISKSADKLSVTIDGINSKSFTLANEYTATTKGTQLRIVSMTITYAE